MKEGEERCTGQKDRDGGQEKEVEKGWERKKVKQEGVKSHLRKESNCPATVLLQLFLISVHNMNHVHTNQT